MHSSSNDFFFLACSVYLQLKLVLCDFGHSLVACVSRRLDIVILCFVVFSNPTDLTVFL